MTQQEKEKYLVNKYYVELKEHKGYYDLEMAIHCAFIAVDGIIKECCKSSEKKDAKYQDEQINYWQQVKHEIENLQTRTMKEQTLEEFINSRPYYGHGTPEYLEGIEVGAKWQQKKMFTEEQLAIAMLDFGLYIAENRGKPIDTDNKIKEIIEQFKQQEQ